MVTGLVRRLYPDGSIKNGRSPLVSLTTNETVELIETRMSGPTIERSGNRNFPRRRFMIFAKGGGAVAVESQHLRERCHTLRTDSGIAGKSGGEFHDSARVVNVVIASCQQRGASGRTKCSRMKIVVPQTSCRQLVECRHFARTAKCAWLSEADVVEQNDDDVRRSFRRFHLESRRCLGIASIKFRNRWGLRLGNRKHGSINLLCHQRQR